jgi:SAM-dependent methyltransferase
MIDDIYCDPTFWQKRIRESHGDLRNAVQNHDDWASSENGHKEIYAKLVSGKVLDAGCGYGRSYKLLPSSVTEYVGMDITPEFIARAKETYPDLKFVQGDIRKIDYPDGYFDWAITTGMAGDSPFWAEAEKELRRVAKNVLKMWISKYDYYEVVKGEEHGKDENSTHSNVKGSGKKVPRVGKKKSAKGV